MSRSLLIALSATAMMPFGAGSLRALTGISKALPLIESIVTGEHFVATPFGYTLLCRRRPEWCNGLSPGSALHAHPELMARIAAVNAEVNAGIVYRQDTLIHFPVRAVATGPVLRTLLIDEWSVSPVAGDCEDYAVTKLERLLDAGLPRSALHFVLARVTATGVYHAMLAVQTDAGTFILDNRSAEIRRWDRIRGLRWLAVEIVVPSGATWFYTARGIDPNTAQELKP